MKAKHSVQDHVSNSVSVTTNPRCANHSSQHTPWPSGSAAGIFSKRGIHKNTPAYTLPHCTNQSQIDEQLRNVLALRFMPNDIRHHGKPEFASGRMILEVCAFSARTPAHHNMIIDALTCSLNSVCLAPHTNLKTGAHQALPSLVVALNLRVLTMPSLAFALDLGVLTSM